MEKNLVASHQIDMSTAQNSEIRLRGENSELRDEVTELASKYSIVTPYTAYLIMEDEGRRNVSMSARSFQGFERDAAAMAASVIGLFHRRSSSSDGTMAKDCRKLQRHDQGRA